MDRDWMRRLLREDVLMPVRMVLGLIAAVLVVLFLADVWSKALHVCLPVLGVIQLLDTLRDWKWRRKNAIFSLCTAVFLFVGAVTVWILD